MRHFTLSILLLSTSLSLGEVAQADELSLTIYNNSRALVSDSRDITFRSGQQTIELPGVSSMIQPETATFVASGLSINEQNFDFDLLSPEKLMEKAVGSFVEIIRTNPGTGRETRERAKVLSVNNGVVIQVGQKIEVLRDDDIPTRVVFDSVPTNLRANPTLSVNVNSQQSGTRDANLTYLTGGLDWRADYVAVFDEDVGKMDLQGWATLTNNTKTTFEDADVAVIAGTVDQAGQYGRNNFNPRNFNPRGGNMRGAGTQQSGQERVGDNYLYPLPGKITVKSNQTKQVGIVDAQGVDAKKVYEYRAYGFNNMNDPQSADVRIAFSNARETGLGTALPAGIFRVYTKDNSGRSQFIGEDAIGHIPGGSSMALKIGDAFDVKVKSQVASNRETGRKTREIEMVYTVTNATDKDTTVFIRQNIGSSYQETTILSENVESTREDAYTALWPVKVSAEGESTLRFKVRQKSRW
ncbi:DUF4139 domain-containing protein [Fretibacter rubidus]|uniref:DUF4139 domain-containing protein n=1 Tax=Fretibacter rubidus TaxID=570162 RepID=UPI00352A982E